MAKYKFSKTWRKQE